MSGMPEEDAQRMTEAIFAGRKIEAIKIYKEATGTGLKESKEFVEDLERQLRAECPERFAAGAKAGCGAVVLLGGAIGLVGWLV
ncbi:MAG: ribosomal protein L7/L12 [Candidatus Hydrogenedentes bacterium]|nr:ribosomal protein L7/L12 [Candidatus Hydrogenedentota bacterium]